MKYDKTITATEYNKVIYRSKTEARLAAFFDKSGAVESFTYEPEDITGYNVDFKVYFKGVEEPVYIEYKPRATYLDIPKYLKFVEGVNFTMIYKTSDEKGLRALSVNDKTLQDSLNNYFIKSPEAKKAWWEVNNMFQNNNDG